MNKGVTLIELVIIIALVGIIFMIAVPAMRDMEEDSCNHRYECVKCGEEM